MDLTLEIAIRAEELYDLPVDPLLPTGGWRRSGTGSKGTFLATLSHEFRTPLNAILGFADLLDLDGTLNAAQAQRVERIKAGGWHLVSMIDEILSFATLDAVQEVVRPEPVDAREIAREAGSLVEPAAGATGLAFVLEVPDGPVDLVTDGGKAR